LFHFLNQTIIHALYYGPIFIAASGFAAWQATRATKPGMAALFDCGCAAALPWAALI
jgi:hypothetical protein